MACGVTTDDTATCWRPTDRSYPVNASPPSDVTFESVSVGWGQALCGVRTDGGIARYGNKGSAIVLDVPTIP